MNKIFNWLWKGLLLLGAAIAVILGIKRNNIESEVKKSNEQIDKANTASLVNLANDIIKRNSNR